MRYDIFVEIARRSAVFRPSLLVSLGDTLRNAQNRLITWEHQGKVWRLKRGLYTLPDTLRAKPLSMWYVANYLYSPSYLSLDFILAFYELIPERVDVVSSVAAAKTATFKNPMGKFTYASIKRSRFFGFEERKDENGIVVRVATPEKALLDRVYFDTTWKDERAYFEENLRLQNVRTLHVRRLLEYAERFASRKIAQAVRQLLLMRKSHE